MSVRPKRGEISCPILRVVMLHFDEVGENKFQFTDNSRYVALLFTMKKDSKQIKVSIAGLSGHHRTIREMGRRSSILYQTRRHKVRRE